jgi:ribonucleoside-diphosphate reductase alpha chain
LSVLPFSDHSYVQSPFESCTEEQFDEMISHLHSIDLTKVIEITDNTTLGENIACSSGACELI